MSTKEPFCHLLSMLRKSDGDIPVCLRKRLLIYVLSEKCMSSAKLFTSFKRIHERCHLLRVIAFHGIIEKFAPFYLLTIFRGKSRLYRVLHAENIFMVCPSPRIHPKSHTGGTCCQTTTCHTRTHASGSEKPCLPTVS